MSACWVFMILMGYRLSHATPSQSACEVQLQTVHVPVGGHVSVPCPELPGKEVTFNLFKDQEMIYNWTRSHEKNATNYEPPHARVGVVLREKADNKSVHFRLTEVNASSLGVYRCEGMVTYPPPYLKKTSDLRILVLVEGLQCTDNDNCHLTTERVHNNTFLWLTAVVVLSIYSLIATTIALVYWMKLRNADFQNDYINTKPSAPRGRGKKRGVTNPIPRHF
uniref:CD28 n=1 Tax=Oplegnathus fasciatus TaxID=163134 RepID=A0A1X9PWX3_OPLFA|nr:CD28 [Oplegnathus fasciatus]